MGAESLERLVGPTFFVSRSDRLTARLASFLGMWRFARQINGQVIVIWPPRREVLAAGLPAEPYNLSLIWDLVQFYREDRHRELLFLDAITRPQGLPSLNDEKWLAMRRHGFDRDSFRDLDIQFGETNTHNLFFAGETPAEIADQLANLFDRIPLSPAIIRAVRSAERKIGGQYAALHVRRGDVTTTLRNAVMQDADGPIGKMTHSYLLHLIGRTAPFDFYDQPVSDAIANGEKLVLFSDSKEVASVFQDRYGSDRIVDGSALGGDELADIQKAMVDFLLLKNSKRIIATSTGYSTFAAKIGKIGHHTVTCRGPAEMFERYLFDEVLSGLTISSLKQNEILDIVRPRYRTAR